VTLGIIASLARCFASFLRGLRYGDLRTQFHAASVTIMLDIGEGSCYNKNDFLGLLPPFFHVDTAPAESAVQH
jgi:hypothetical protein